MYTHLLDTTDQSHRTKVLLMLPKFLGMTRAAAKKPEHNPHAGVAKKFVSNFVSI